MTPTTPPTTNDNRLNPDLPLPLNAGLSHLPSLRRAPAAVVTAEAAPATAAPAAAPASAAAKSASGGSRRALLASLAAAGALALSSPAPPPAAAAIGVWDGTSAASGSCAVGPDGDACRARTIAKDFGERAAGDGGGGYGESIKASSGLATNSNSIPIPSMQGPYVSETRALSASIREYLALAPSDASRVPKGKALRKAGAVWAAKYAPGGSARLKSARCVNNVAVFFVIERKEIICEGGGAGGIAREVKRKSERGREEKQRKKLTPRF